MRSRERCVRMAHGDAVTRLVALAGTERVSSYTRTSKTGKTVHVSAYTRDPGKMSNVDLVQEYASLKDKVDPQSRNRAQQIVNEVNKRKQTGEWNKGDHYTPGQGNKAPSAPSALKPQAKAASSSAQSESKTQNPESDFGSTSNAALAKKAKSGDQSAVEEVKKRVAAKQWGHSSASARTQARAKVDKSKGATQRGRAQARAEFEKNKRAPQAKITDAEYAEHEARIASIINDPKNAKYDTQKQHGIFDADGHFIAYTPERTEQHRKIIEDVLAEHPKVKAEKKAVMTGGLGGSGKGTIMSGKFAPVNTDEYITVDPDEMKAELLKRGMGPDIPGLLPMEQANFIHEESSDLANMLHEVAMKKGLNVILDTTMASDKSVDKKIKKFEQNGYNDIHGVFTDVPVNVSVASALGRHRGGVDRFRAGAEDKGGDLGGRYVPPGYIKKSAPDPGSPEEAAGYNSKNRGVFERMKDAGRFKSYEVWDTSDRSKGPDGKTKPPRLVYKGSRGSKSKDATAPEQTTARALDQLNLSAAPLAVDVLRARLINVEIARSGFGSVTDVMYTDG